MQSFEKKKSWHVQCGLASACTSTCAGIPPQYTTGSCKFYNIIHSKYERHCDGHIFTRHLCYPRLVGLGGHARIGGAKFGFGLEVVGCEIL